MSIMQRIAKTVLSIALLTPFMASADVVRPSLDIGFFAGDTGAELTDFGDGTFDFDIDATAFAIVVDELDNFIDIANQDFILHGSRDTATESYFTGTFSVAGGLLSGTFNNLNVSMVSGSLDFAADLIYTSGSLMGSLSGGRIEGIGNSSNIGAKLGEVAVVPVPAAAWLFGSGLISLVGIARRKTA